MFLKRQAGPRIATLPDGTTMTRADLPDPRTRRWVASRKAAVVQAVRCGLIGEDEACETYDLSSEELASWLGAVKCYGENALKTTHLQEYRHFES